jgi:hypothetical protein
LTSRSRGRKFTRSRQSATSTSKQCLAKTATKPSPGGKILLARLARLTVCRKHIASSKKISFMSNKPRVCICVHACVCVCVCEYVYMCLRLCVCNFVLTCPSLLTDHARAMSCTSACRRQVALFARSTRHPADTSQVSSKY